MILVGQFICCGLALPSMVIGVSVATVCSRVKRLILPLFSKVTSKYCP